MPLYGYSVKDPNYILRFAVIVFMGVIATGSVLFWKSQLMLTADYQEMPITHGQRKIKKENEARQRLLKNLSSTQAEN